MLLLPFLAFLIPSQHSSRFKNNHDFSTIVPTLSVNDIACINFFVHSQFFLNIEDCCHKISKYIIFLIDRR